MPWSDAIRVLPQKRKNQKKKFRDAHCDAIHSDDGIRVLKKKRKTEKSEYLDAFVSDEASGVLGEKVLCSSSFCVSICAFVPVKQVKWGNGAPK